MILKGITYLYNYLKNINGEVETVSTSPLISFKENTIVINGDLEIEIKGNLKIKTDKHMVLKTSKLPSNDEYDVYSIHLNPKDESYIEIGKIDE